MSIPTRSITRRSMNYSRDFSRHSSSRDQTWSQKSRFFFFSAFLRATALQWELGSVYFSASEPWIWWARIYLAGARPTPLLGDAWIKGHNGPNKWPGVNLSTNFVYRVRWTECLRGLPSTLAGYKQCQTPPRPHWVVIDGLGFICWRV